MGWERTSTLAAACSRLKCLKCSKPHSSNMTPLHRTPIHIVLTLLPKNCNPGCVMLRTHLLPYLSTVYSLGCNRSWAQLTELQVTLPEKEETPLKSTLTLQSDPISALWSTCYMLHSSFNIPGSQDAMCRGDSNRGNRDIDTDPPGNIARAPSNGPRSAGEFRHYGATHSLVQHMMLTLL